MQLVNKVKNAIERKTQNMKMTKDNMQLLTELENKVISIYRDGFFGSTHIVFIIDDNQKVIHQDDGISDPYTQTYQEYIDTLYMNLVAPGGTVYKDNHEMMTPEEYVERSLKLLDEVELEYETKIGDIMDGNANKLQEVNDIICQKIDNVKLTRENIEKMLKFDMDISGVDYHAFIYGNHIMNYGLDDAKYDIAFEDYVKEFKGVCDWGIAGGGACETPEELLKKFNELGLIYEDGEKMTNEEKSDKMDCENLVNKILDSDTIPLWEKRGIIGVGKSFEENRDHLNDILLDVTDDIWDEVLDEATKRYMESLPVEKTREDIIDEIVELCEEDTEYDMVEEVCEWLVDKSKYILQYFLYVGDIQQFVDEKIKRTRLGNVFLYCATEAEDTIIDLRTWAYYEKIGQGDNFSKEELEELYEKFVR